MFDSGSTVKVRNRIREIIESCFLTFLNFRLWFQIDLWGWAKALSAYDPRPRDTLGIHMRPFGAADRFTQTWCTGTLSSFVSWRRKMLISSSSSRSGNYGTGFLEQLRNYALLPYTFILPHPSKYEPASLSTHLLAPPPPPASALKESIFHGSLRFCAPRIQTDH